MVSYKSINPFNGEVYQTFDIHSDAFVEEAIQRAKALHLSSKRFTTSYRLQAAERLGDLLIAQKHDLAHMISGEVGKVLSEALAEIEKCAWLCRYYANYAEEFLKPERIDLNPDEAIRQYEPLGVILGVMPWNFPFWQVFRFAIPALLAGNRVLLKHAPNCPSSAEAIERLFNEVFPAGAYQNLRLSNEHVSRLLARPEVKGLSLTGSTGAGSKVAQIAAKYLKPQLLELGGSNAFVVFEGADPQKAAELASKARLLNAGQSCIAAKRFIAHRSLAEEFKESLISQFRNYKVGDPLSPGTDIGPLARRDLADKVFSQIQEGIEQGAQLLEGGSQNDNFISPTIIEIKDPKNVLFNEEVFGPVATIITFDDVEEAIAISNQSSFGLGVSLIGPDPHYLSQLAPSFEEGAVFINELVKSDPRLPFGGVKNSGYGRELGPEGIRSFTNLKTIYLKSELE